MAGRAVVPEERQECWCGAEGETEAHVRRTPARPGQVAGQVQVSFISVPLVTYMYLRVHTCTSLFLFIVKQEIWQFFVFLSAIKFCENICFHFRFLQLVYGQSINWRNICFNFCD